MDRLKFYILLVVALTSIRAQTVPNGDDENIVVRWCVVNDAEAAKCQEFKTLLANKTASNADPGKVIRPFYCVRGKDVFDCMKKIELFEADLITLDAGQGYFAGRYHAMMPILHETYDAVGGTPEDALYYYAVAVVKKTSRININLLQGTNACIPAIGTAAGWMNPISALLKRGIIQLTECNAVVKSVTEFFKQMCLPGALSSFYNPFGNNPTTVCELCTGSGEQRCTTSGTSAGFDGAFKCMANGNGDVAFLRHDTVDEMYKLYPRYDPSDYELLCLDNTRRAIGDHANCNMGRIKANIVMTSSVTAKEKVAVMKALLLQAAQWYGTGALNQFNLFNSYKYRDMYGERGNLMFTDSTVGLKDVGDLNTYYNWVDQEFLSKLDELNECPVAMARWCVTSLPEKRKCEEMMMAFQAKDLRPRLDCMLGEGTHFCMKMIANGDADLMAMDAGDVYLAGKTYNLVPIASEGYGDMVGKNETSKFHVVAVARKTDAYMTMFNLKGKRSCQAGIGRGDGWVVPLNIFIETEQFLPQQCTIFKNIGELFIRSCIPGSLDEQYNPNQHPINLCEGCAAGGYRKCERNSEEQYYGATGAFRCLVEKGGDVAFVRHLTVRDNTDGRNHAIWARNRRSDDYELMCKDGKRTQIDNWRQCHLGTVPANAIVVGDHQSARDRKIYWNLLNYGQQFFSSDHDGDFHMFDSGTWYNDLMFTDDAVRLIQLPSERQNFRSYLGEDFIAQIENLHEFSCVPVAQNLNEDSCVRPAGAAGRVTAAVIMNTLITVLITFLIF